MGLVKYTNLVHVLSPTLTHYLIFSPNFQPDGEDDLKKRQLMELAIINGTYRDTTKPSPTVAQPSASSRKFSDVDQHILCAVFGFGKPFSFHVTVFG